MRPLRGMIITTARPQDPALQGWTPHIPSAPRLNAYLDMFNDADVSAQRATNMPLTRELSINVTAPMLFHYGPPPEGWDESSLDGLEGYGFGGHQSMSQRLSGALAPLAPVYTQAPVRQTNAQTTQTPNQAPPPQDYQAPTDQPPVITDGGAAGFPWWILLVLGAGYLAVQR